MINFKVLTIALSLVIASLATQAHAAAPAAMSDAQIVSQANGAKLSSSLKNQMLQIVNENLKKFNFDVMIQLNKNASKAEAEALLGIRLDSVVGDNIAVATLTAREVLFLTTNASVQLIEADGPLHPNPSFTSGN